MTARRTGRDVAPWDGPEGGQSHAPGVTPESMLDDDPAWASPATTEPAGSNAMAAAPLSAGQRFTQMRLSSRQTLTKMRLSSRIVLASMALLLLVQLAGLLATRHSIDANAHAQLADRLALGQRVWQRLLEQRAAKLNQGAAVLAADYGLREAVASNDLATLQSALDNHGARIGATQAAWLDTTLALRASASSSPPAQSTNLPATLKRLAPRLAQHPGQGLLALVDGQPHQFVMVPMRAPVVIGWVVMGFALDEALVRDMHAVSGLEAALVLRPAQGEPRLLASSFSSPSGVPSASTAPLATQPADGDLLINQEPYLVSTLLLADDAGAQASLRLAGSVAAAVAPYRGLQWVLAGITAAGLVLFGVGSVVTARRVTRPLRNLVRATERLGAGQYDQPLQHTGRGDEIGDLARAFDHMRLNIAAHEQQVRRLAYWDRLTGLPNRLQFRDLVLAAIDHAAVDQAQADALDDGPPDQPATDQPATPHATAAQAAIAQASQRPLAVLMLDLDRFKHVNDVLGYAFGDQLLEAVAQRLRQVVRDGDSIARLGGDEFALLMPGADVATAEALAQRLAQAFEQPLTLGEHTVDLSAGIGIAVWPLHATDGDTLLSRAEVAMYAAKRRTAGAQVYDPAVDTASALNLSLLTELKRAVDGDELRLYLQPKIDIASGALIGAEALVRWQHPTRGLVPPMDFIPFAEQTGFIRQLTLWVLDAAASELATLGPLGVRCISVNLSTRDLMDQDLPDKLEAILRRRQAKAEGLCLEITESAIMDDPQRAEATLNRLAERGYKLSIDDFGTGYSSLAYLKRLPVAELKIDKSFVMGMARDKGDATIVRSTIDLAHNLGLSVVAEGVESAAILALLHELRCDEGQGFHMSKPLPIADFIAIAARWQARPAARSGLGMDAPSLLH